MKPLHKLSPGERAYIVDMNNSLICEKLFELGVFPGSIVEMKYNAAQHNSVIVTINGHTYNLFKPAAETIMTSTIFFEIGLN